MKIVNGIPIIEDGDITENWIAYGCFWLYTFSFWIDDLKFCAPWKSTKRFKGKKMVALMENMQSAVDIRFGAHMNGYRGCDKEELWNNAKEFFSKNPQYEMEFEDDETQPKVV